MKTYVLLNGKTVEASAIDPAKHRYLGMFRPPTNWLIPVTPGYVLCPCGQTLQMREQSIDHYRMGHCDMQQYVDIQ